MKKGHKRAEKKRSKRGKSLAILRKSEEKPAIVTPTTGTEISRLTEADLAAMEKGDLRRKMQEATLKLTIERAGNERAKRILAENRLLGQFVKVLEGLLELVCETCRAAIDKVIENAETEKEAR